jgi:hypothetical protein
LVQESRFLERSVPNGLAKVVLEHAAFATIRAADNHIAEPYVMTRAGRAASDAHHQPDAHVWKAVNETLRYHRR